MLQDYEGTVTIKPSWGLRDLAKFLSNFDAPRIDKFFRDGERATYPKIELIRSLCEIEFCLDEIAAELQASMVASRRFKAERPAAGAPGAIDGSAVPSSPRRVTISDDEGPFSPRSEPAQSNSFSDVGTLTRGKVPSYVSLPAYGAEAAEREADKGATAYPVTEGIPASGSATSLRLPGVASSASLLNLLGLESLG